MALKILYVGAVGGTTRHRAEALEDLGHHVVRIVSDRPAPLPARALRRLGNLVGRPVDLYGANRAIRRMIGEDRYDLLWVDKGLTIRPETLRRAREASPVTRLVAYSPDDQMNPNNQTPYWLGSVPLFDLHVTTKTYNVPELTALGARNVIFVDNAYDPRRHCPMELTDEERRRFAADVGFVGGYEEERARMMLQVAESGIEVTVFGYGWQHCPVSHPKLIVRNELLRGTDYAKALIACKINLGFLRRINRDLQTTRSIEIPACGAFMLAERTDEHLGLFAEGEEAEFFESTEELVRKCRHYLDHEEERLAIAAGGLRRCRESDYSNAGRLSRVLQHPALRGS